MCLVPHGMSVEELGFILGLPSSSSPVPLGKLPQSASERTGGELPRLHLVRSLAGKPLET